MVVLLQSNKLVDLLYHDVGIGELLNRHSNPDLPHPLPHQSESAYLCLQDLCSPPF